MLFICLLLIEVFMVEGWVLEVFEMFEVYFEFVSDDFSIIVIIVFVLVWFFEVLKDEFIDDGELWKVKIDCCVELICFVLVKIVIENFLDWVNFEVVIDGDEWLLYFVGYFCLMKFFNLLLWLSFCLILSCVFYLIFRCNCCWGKFR